MEKGVIRGNLERRETQPVHNTDELYSSVLTQKLGLQQCSVVKSGLSEALVFQSVPSPQNEFFPALGQKPTTGKTKPRGTCISSCSICLSSAAMWAVKMHYAEKCSTRKDMQGGIGSPPLVTSLPGSAASQRRINFNPLFRLWDRVLLVALHANFDSRCLSRGLISDVDLIERFFNFDINNTRRVKRTLRLLCFPCGRSANTG